MDKVKIIKTETEELLKKMIDQFEVEVKEIGDVYHIMIKTEEASTVVGRRGATIRSLQKILEVILYKKFGQPMAILVNVNDYRERQKERLENLAKEYADKTIADQRSYSLHKLNSFERRIIHEYIANHYSGLTSYSVGEGKDKKLIIDIKKDSSPNKLEERT